MIHAAKISGGDYNTLTPLEHRQLAYVDLLNFKHASPESRASAGSTMGTARRSPVYATLQTFPL
jgi:hypothetical protein